MSIYSYYFKPSNENSVLYNNINSHCVTTTHNVYVKLSLCLCIMPGRHTRGMKVKLNAFILNLNTR